MTDHACAEPDAGFIRIDRDRYDDDANLFMAGAVIHEGAHFGTRNRFMPYAVIGADVVLGDDNEIGSFAVVGAPSQGRDKLSSARLQVGDRNRIHSHATVCVGSAPIGTMVANDVIIMSGAHIGHDSRVGSNVVVGNYAQIAGYVTIDDDAVIGAHACVVQRLHVGSLAHVLPRVVCRSDVQPFETRGEGSARRLNSIAVRRRGGTWRDAKLIRAAWADLNDLRGPWTIDYDLGAAFARMQQY